MHHYLENKYSRNLGDLQYIDFLDSGNFDIFIHWQDFLT